MAITSTGYQAPAIERVGLKPSVLDKIIMLGDFETPIMSKVGRCSVASLKHAWITDKFKQPKYNAHLEITGFDTTAASTKQKTENAIQIFKDEVFVSDSMQKIATYGGNELAHETGKVGKEHAKDLEYSFFGLGRDANAQLSVFEAPTVRTDSVAGETAGIFHFLAKGDAAFVGNKRGNVISSAATSWNAIPQVLTWDAFNAILQVIYDNGATPKDVYVGAELKKAINAFVTRQLGNESMANKRITTLETDFGTVNIMMHRYLSAAHGLGDVVLAGDFDFAKFGTLIDTNLKDVVTDKTGTAKRFYTEGCWEISNADAFAAGVGYKA